MEIVVDDEDGTFLITDLLLVAGLWCGVSCSFKVNIICLFSCIPALGFCRVVVQSYFFFRSSSLEVEGLGRGYPSVPFPSASKLRSRSGEIPTITL